MKEYTIGKNEANQRFDKYLHKLLKEAGSGFLYKMLRKKNITLNGKKADGTEKLKEGDVVKLFLSDETFLKFTGNTLEEDFLIPKEKREFELPVLYEDEDILIVNKPKGMLSQKSSPKDISANEYILDYLMWKNALSKEEIHTFRPSICNRLDRNTSGLLIAGKTLKGLQNMAKQLKERSVKKYYCCIVKGKIEKSQKISGYLLKNEKTNKVTVLKENADQAKYIETEYQPLAQLKGDYTLLEVHLITGRSHQIRAHLASIGHPVLGDEKYGDHILNRKLYQEFQIKGQLLHAYRLEFSDGFEVTAPLPEEFRRIREGL